jgi:uncharacterized membrane protein YgcG
VSLADEILNDVLLGMSIEEALTRRGFLKGAAAIGLGAALIAGAPRVAAAGGGVILPGSAPADTSHQMHRPGGHEEPSAVDQIIGGVLRTGEKALKTGRVDLPGVSTRLPKGVRQAGQVVRQVDKSYRQITGPWADRFGLGAGRERPKVNPAWKRAGQANEGMATRAGSSTDGVGTSGSTGMTGATGGGGGASSGGGGSSASAGSTATKSASSSPASTTTPTTKNSKGSSTPPSSGGSVSG